MGGAPRAIIALALALLVGGCGSQALETSNGSPVALTVAVPAPMRGELAAIVRSVDPRARVATISPRPGTPPRSDVVIAIAATDFVAHPRLIRAGFAADSYLGRLASSIVAFGVAPGNPHRVRTWGDLLSPSVRMVVTDPMGDDGGRLEVLSAATAIFTARHRNRFAQDYVRRLLTKADLVPTENGAVARFASGQADVVVTTEDRLLAARDRGVPVKLVYPPVATPVVLEIGVAAHARHPVAGQALVDALRAPGAQRALARAGLRPVLDGFASPDRFRAFDSASDPSIMGDRQLVARSYFGRNGVVRDARRAR